MNLTEAILARGNDKSGEAAALWATGIHSFVYKKRGKVGGVPFVRLEVDRRGQNVTVDSIATFQVFEDSQDTNPTRADEILEQIGRLFHHCFLPVDDLCFGDIWETDRRTEGREGIWRPEIEFMVQLTR